LFNYTSYISCKDTKKKWSFYSLCYFYLST